MNNIFIELCKDLRNVIKTNNYTTDILYKVYPEDIDDETIYYIIEDIENIILELGNKGKVEDTFNLLYRDVIQKDEIVTFHGTFSIILEYINDDFINKFKESLNKIFTHIHIKNEDTKIYLTYQKCITYEEILQKGN